MTLAELEPLVAAALTDVEWDATRVRWRQGLLDERAAIQKALPLAGRYGIEVGPLQMRLAQIDIEYAGDVTADRVAQSPIRSVPMDLITEAVARRILQVPDGFPILSLKVTPTPEAIKDAVARIASRWATTSGPVPDESLHQGATT